MILPTPLTPAIRKLVEINNTAPENPRATPIAFLGVIGSFKIKAESIKAKMGIVVVMIPALMGEVRLKPMV